MKSLLIDIYDAMEKAIGDLLNYHVDGSINHNFIEADVYLDLAGKYDVQSPLFRDAVDIAFEEYFGS